MACRSMLCAYLGAVAFCLYASVAAGQSSTAILNYVPRATELDGRPPELFTFFKNDLFVVVDPVDNRVVVIARNGRISGASIPLPFVPDKVSATEAAVEFTQQSTGRRAILPRSADPAQLGALSIQDEVAAPANAPPAVSRLAGQTITIRVGDGAKQLVVRSRSRGYLSDVQLIGRDDSGRYYVQSTEVVDTEPRIRVRVFAQRFSTKSALLDIAEVPIANMDSVPGKMVALVPSGDIVAIVPTETGLFLQPLIFEAASAGKRVLAPASAPVQTRIDATIADLGPRDTTPEVLEPAAVLPPTTREQILARANRYLTANWTMQPENFSRANIENRCAKIEGKYWSRPKRFTEGEIGKTFGAVPYNWGGADTPEGYVARISSGALAGNVCTCREAQYNQCQVNEAAGVDCSGFVSRAWGIAKRGTSALAQVATPIRKLQDLRPGDAFNRAGSHVRLLVAVRAGPQMQFDVLESAANLRCEGVCKSTYSAAQLAGYQPLRFSGVIN